MNPPAILHFAHSAALADALATDVATGLGLAIAARGSARLVVSGGKSPVPFFDALSHAALDWRKVGITLSDERWVDAASPDSNERLVRQHLLQHLAAFGHFTGLKGDAPSAEAGCMGAWAAMRDIGMAADEIILGMGEDGHVASLFPGMPGINVAMDPGKWCGLVPATAPTAPTERISLNLAAILSARQIRLQIPGTAKRMLLQRVLAEPDAQRWPVAAVLTQAATPVVVYTAD